jgi:hypothetical protein
LSVSNFFFYFLNLIHIVFKNRSEKAQNRAYRVHHYSLSTGTGTLRNHLIKCHRDKWVSECKRLNITIKAEAGLEALALHEGENPKTEASRPSYSSELFINALTDFIVATDQVFFLFLCFFLLLIFFISLSAL